MAQNESISDTKKRPVSFYVIAKHQYSRGYYKLMESNTLFKPIRMSARVKTTLETYYSNKGAGENSGWGIYWTSPTYNP